MEIISVSISEDRVAVALPNNTTAQFVVWDLEEAQHASLESQIEIAFSICSTFDQIEKHLKLNGFDASLEEIYNS